MTSIFRLITFLFCLFILTQCDSPKSEEVPTDKISQQFDADIKQFFGYLNQEQWDNMLDMTNPYVFNIAPREVMVNMFKGQKESGITMSVNNTKVKSHSDVMEFEGNYYSKITYEGTMKMILSEALMNNMEVFKQELFKTHDKEDVRIDMDNNSIVINAEQQMVAMSNDEQKSWKYFEIQEGQMQLISKVLPKEVFEKIIVNEKM